MCFFSIAVYIDVTKKISHKYFMRTYLKLDNGKYKYSEKGHSEAMLAVDPPLKPFFF